MVHTRIKPHLRWRRVVFLWMICLISLATPLAAWAQTADPTPAPNSAEIPFVHTVAEGENITYIASLYGVTVEEILLINNLDPEAVLSLGQEIIIPGGEGDAVATLYQVQAGDTIDHIAAIFNTTSAEILTSNQRPNPWASLVAGESLVVVSRTGSSQPQPISGVPHVVSAGETVTTVAARYGMTPRELAEFNGRTLPTFLLPGQRLHIPNDSETYRFLPGEWTNVEVQPLPIAQGDTVTVFVSNVLDGRPAGTLGDQPLNFFPHEDGFVALVGVDAFTEPGTLTLKLEGSGSRPWRPFTQPIAVESRNYGLQSIVVGPELGDLLREEVRQEEDEFLAPIYLNSAPEPLWEGIFQAPVSPTVLTAGYGDSRTYNDGPVFTFHTGVDFAGIEGTPVLAVANGVVVFADFLNLRGLTVIVDHGAGVMSAYFHLSEILVAVEERVEIGQTIGSGGSTGLSTGPHLHWDLRINNTAVNGLQWLENQYP